MAVSDLGYLLSLPQFEHREVKTIGDACRLLTEYQDRAVVIAGGTDLLVLVKKRRISPRCVIDIKNIPDLDYIDYNQQGGLKIGALARLHSIASSTIVKEKFGPLAESCNKIGTPQVRNMGTIGGNICTAGPSQDSVPALLVLDASLKLVGPDGERIVPVEEFFVAPFQTAINRGELLTEIRIPTPPPMSAGRYEWLTKWTAVDETLVGVAVHMTRDPGKDDVCQDIKIALCSVAPTPLRARQAEALLVGKRFEATRVEQAGRTAAREIKPRSRAGYRREMTALLVARTITEVWSRIKQR